MGKYLERSFEIINNRIQMESSARAFHLYSIVYYFKYCILTNLIAFVLAFFISDVLAYKDVV
jgi:hypothetical protein